MQIREALSHAETHRHIFVCIELVRHLYLCGEAVQRFSCHHIQSTVDRQVGDIIEQTTCPFGFLYRHQLILDGGGIGHPGHEIVATRIGGGDRYKLDILFDINLDGVLV